MVSVDGVKVAVRKKQKVSQELRTLREISNDRFSLNVMVNQIFRRVKAVQFDYFGCGKRYTLFTSESLSVLEPIHLSHTQRKEWTWDESKMMIMQDPIYRLVILPLPFRPLTL